MTSPELLEVLHDILATAPTLEEVKEWNKANSLMTLASPGGSIGLEKEEFEPYTRDEDEATAFISIVLWVKHPDPVEGEAAVRNLAQKARGILVRNYTLNGAAETSTVKNIRYATADGGKSLLLHLAEIDLRVIYMVSRIQDDSNLPTVGSVEQNWDFE